MNAFYQSPLQGSRPYRVGIGGSGFDAHWHAELEILYVLSGTLQVTVEERLCTAMPGWAVFVGAATIHAIGVCSADTRYLVMEFGPALLGDGYVLFRERRLTQPLTDLTEPGKTALRGTLDAIAQWVREAQQGTQAEWRLRSLLYTAAAQTADLPHVSETSGERARRLLSLRRMQGVLSSVEADPARPWRVADAAGLAGLEEKAFCRSFRAVTGRTFHRYLNETRVEAARLMLAEDDLPVSRVGETVGFQEPKTFSRVFRSVSGQSPSAYRRDRNQHIG